MQEITVCRSAFLAIHGLKKGKVEFLVKSLKCNAAAPIDKRGHHFNRPHKISEDILSKVRDHISSFPSRNSHYGLKDSGKQYLEAELCVTKMYKLFQLKHPELKLSCEIYRQLFKKEYNISFGYPRTDTCSTCDEITAKIKSLRATQKNTTIDSTEYQELNVNIKNLERDRLVHKKRAATFYSRKNKAKKRGKISKQFHAVALDYMKNLPIPNITTNDVYYKRQLSIYGLNIHSLSTGESVFYLYPETIGKKAAMMCAHFCTIMCIFY